MFTLISATPSPYARKIRVALLEKGIPFSLQTEVPWNSNTTVWQYNPLEKLPILIPNQNDDENNENLDSCKAIYESHFILDYLEAKFPNPPLYPSADRIDERLFARQVQVVADGICDAAVLTIFERKRASPSQPWLERQMRKINGGLRALAAWIDDKSSNSDFLIGDSLTIADIAIVSVLGFIAVRMPEHQWQEDYPQLRIYWLKLDARPSFSSTRPYPQNIKDDVM